MDETNSNEIEFRIFKIIETNGAQIINEELIATKKTFPSAIEYLNNTVKHSSDNKAYRKFYMSKFIKEGEEWKNDKEFKMFHVGGPKNAGDLMEDLGLEDK